MPESPEVRILSDFINIEIGKCDVIKVEKSPLSKSKCDLSMLEGKAWKMTASSRGKEMIILFTSGIEKYSLKVGFAKIGAIESISYEDIDSEYFYKRAVLRFYTKDRIYFISDFTRYTLWRWTDQWDANRSPDVALEHNAWRAHIYQNRNIPYFERPIFDLLIDQRFFNGIGIFSRSEILCRTRFSPFTPFKEILDIEILREDFFKVCKDTLNDITVNGGLQFKHWKNPFGVENKIMNKWVRCYNKLPKTFYTNDSRGRRFWFEKKWIPDYVKWIEDKEVQDTRLLEKIYKYKNKTIKLI